MGDLWAWVDRRRWLDQYGGWRQWILQVLIVLIVGALMVAYWYATERGR